MSRSVLIHGDEAELVEKLAAETARQLGVPWIDKRGSSWDEVIALSERDAGCVTSVNSGMLLDRTRRVEALAKWTVVGLELAGSWVTRLAKEVGGEVGAVAALLGRELREAHVFVGTAPTEVGSVVKRVVEASRSRSVAVAAGSETYLVDVGKGNVEVGLSMVGMASPVMLYLTDENVERLHGASLGRATAATGMRVVKHVLMPGEEQKRLETLAGIFDRALEGG